MILIERSLCTSGPELEDHMPVTETLPRTFIKNSFLEQFPHRMICCLQAWTALFQAYRVKLIRIFAVREVLMDFLFEFLGLTFLSRIR